MGERASSQFLLSLDLSETPNSRRNSRIASPMRRVAGVWAAPACTDTSLGDHDEGSVLCEARQRKTIVHSHSFAIDGVFAGAEDGHVQFAVAGPLLVCRVIQR